MQQVTLFILPYCIYCRHALKLIESVRSEQDCLKAVPIRIVDERKDRELAMQHDYFYVPTFYIGDRKVHEGPVNKGQVLSILREALEEPNV